MRDQNRDDVGLANRLGRLAKRDIRKPRQFLGQGAQIRIGDDDPFLPAARQLRHDRDRRALAQIVDVGLVGQPETGDDRMLEALGPLADLRDDETRLGVVDFARGADQPRSLRRG